MQSNISNIHATARLYAEAGIPVFPCEANGKRPATKNGFYDATTDLNDIDRWWTENPNYNLAIQPADANLFVIDIDPGADPDFVNKLPDTYKVRTPRGGWHFYYEGTGRTTASKLAPHIDTRSVHGYVLVPPSQIDGRLYTSESALTYSPIPDWIPERLAVVDAPLKSAVDTLDLPGNITRAKNVLIQAVERGDVAIEGQGGDDRTYRMCCELLDLGVSVEKAKDLIEEIWNPHCMPPWDSGALDLKFENASRYQQNEGGAYGVEAPQDVFGDAVRKLGLQGEPQKLSRFHFKDEGEMDDEPDPKWLVKDVISEASTVMLYGASGSYKSFLAMDLCLAIATGSATFGSQTQPGLVFYAALEGRAHLRKARKAWRILKGTEGKIENFFLGVAPMIGVEGEMQEFGDQIALRCAGRKPALIVIDTLTKSMAGLNENDAADAGKFIRFCDSLVEVFGCAVMAIHHTGKEEGRGARGSSAFLAGFDSVLEVRAHKATKAVSVFVRKHKDAEERETPWTFEGRVTGTSLTFEETTAEQHKLLTGESSAITPKTIGAALKKLNAFGQPAAVTSAVLATELTQSREGQSAEEHSTTIARTTRAITSLSKGMLEAYVTRQGKVLYWSLPAAGDV